MMQIPTFAEALGALNLGTANPFAEAPVVRVASFGCDPRNELLARLAAAQPRAPPLARAMLGETFAPLGAAAGAQPSVAEHMLLAWGVVAVEGAPRNESTHALLMESGSCASPGMPP